MKYRIVRVARGTKTVWFQVERLEAGCWVDTAGSLDDYCDTLEEAREKVKSLKARDVRMATPITFTVVE